MGACVSEEDDQNQPRRRNTQSERNSSSTQGNAGGKKFYVDGEEVSEFDVDKDILRTAPAGAGCLSSKSKKRTSARTSGEGNPGEIKEEGEEEGEEEGKQEGKKEENSEEVKVFAVTKKKNRLIGGQHVVYLREFKGDIVYGLDEKIVGNNEEVEGMIARVDPQAKGKIRDKATKMVLIPRKRVWEITKSAGGFTVKVMVSYNSSKKPATYVFMAKYASDVEGLVELASGFPNFSRG